LSPKITVGAPILGEFDGGARQLAGILLKLGFEPLEQRERIGGGAGKTADDRAAAKTAHFLGVRLNDGLADRDLAVAADRDQSALADRQNGRAVPGAGMVRFYR
jgi:hypothetical protein